jgi:hypothetical protein
VRAARASRPTSTASVLRAAVTARRAARATLHSLPLCLPLSGPSGLSLARLASPGVGAAWLSLSPPLAPSLLPPSLPPAAVLTRVSALRRCESARDPSPAYLRLGSHRFRLWWHWLSSCRPPCPQAIQLELQQLRAAGRRLAATSGGDGYRQA